MRNVTLTAVVALIVSAACTVKDTKVPDLTGPSALATSMRLSATPDAVPADGASKSVVVVQAVNSAGQPFPSVVLNLAVASLTPDVPVGSLSASRVVTGADGKASVVFTSPAAAGLGFAVNRVFATPTGLDASNSNSSTFQVDINLLPVGAAPPIIVVPNSPAPTAEFTSSPSSPIVNQNVFFNGSGSKASVGHSISSYRWDFGDGTSDSTSGVSPVHQYALAGTYNVSLTVTDNVGAQATKTNQVVVGQGTPKASFTFVVTNPGAHTVVFDGGSSTAVAPFQITNWAWTFGDGGSGSGAVVSHWYGGAGNVPVTLTVTDSNGKTASVTQIVTVP